MLGFFAPLLVAFLQMFVGATWYSEKMFADAWMKYMNLTPERIAEVHPTKGSSGYIAMFALTVLQNTVLMHLVSSTNLLLSLFVAVVLASAFILPTLVTHTIFSDKKNGVIWIDAGYQFTNIILASVIFTFWPQ